MFIRIEKVSIFSFLCVVSVTAETHSLLNPLDSRLRGNDNVSIVIPVKTESHLIPRFPHSPLSRDGNNTDESYEGSLT